MKSSASPSNIQRLFRRHNGMVFLLALFFLQFVLAMAGCGFKGTANSPSGNTPGAVAVSVTPHSISLQVSTQQQFSATVTNTTNTNVTWSATGGTISLSGMYTAPNTAGTFTVTVTSQADPSKSDQATVVVTTTPPPPTPTPTPTPTPSPTPTPTPTPTPAPATVSVVVSPSIISVPSGATQQFSATVAGSTNTAVTWTATSGSITSTGLYTAPASAGTATVKATSVADTTKSASAQVLIGGSGTALAQAAASVVPGHWLRFTAAENASWGGGSVLDLTPTAATSDNATTWGSKGVWNPVTKEFYFVGGGHCFDCREVLRYSDATNTWSVTFHDGTHEYEGLAINTSAGLTNNLYYRPYSSNSIEVYEISSQTWTSNLSPVPQPGGPDCCLAMEYFPDRNSLITIDNDWGIYEYTFSNGQWSSCLFGTSSDLGCPNGTHPICGVGSATAPWSRYDSVHHRLILGGCTNVYALSPTLTLTQLPSSPFPISAATYASPVTYDPGTGMLISWDISGNTFIFDGTSWINSGPSPFRDPVNGGLACAPISSYNVVMCFYAGTNSRPVTNGTVWLYKAP